MTPQRSADLQPKAARPYLVADFEKAPGEEWKIESDGYRFGLDDAQVHGGRYSLRLERIGDGKEAAASLVLPVEELRGQRVRVRAWVKTAGIDDGWAGVWVASGESSTADDSHETTSRGDSGWREQEAELLVPAAAKELRVGVKLAAPGTAWFDDLAVDVLPPAVAAELEQKVRIEGRVTDRGGKALAGMFVALQGGARSPVGFALSDRDGRFGFDALPGDYIVAASSSTIAGGSVLDLRVPPGRPRLGVSVIAGGPAVTVSGKVTLGGAPASVRWVTLWGSGPFGGGTYFTVPVNAEGRYEVAVPEGEYYASAADDAYQTFPRPEPFHTSARRVADISVVSSAALAESARDSVIAALRERTFPLAAVEAGHARDDLQPLRAIVGQARIVGLGEATHGTREFFQLKHRIFEHLVSDLGFTVFLIESSLPAGEAVNDYIQTGQGDPKAALAGMHFWIYNTEEVLALIEWMRSWNADPKHRRKLSFYGVDMQFPSDSASRILPYLERVDRVAAAAARATLAPVLTLEVAKGFRARTSEAKEAFRAQVKDLSQRFDREQRRWVRKGGRRSWLLARRYLRVIEQYADVAVARRGESSAVRDRAMAENAKWAIGDAEHGARAVLWAHNGHVSRNREYGATSLGQHLVGPQYVNIGFSFGEGSFSARLKDQGWALGTATVGAPPTGGLDATLRRLGYPLALVDLRTPSAPLATWLASPRIARETGWPFLSEEDLHQVQITGDRYDALIYVDRTTASRQSDVPPVR